MVNKTTRPLTVCGHFGANSSLPTTPPLLPPFSLATIFNSRGNHAAASEFLGGVDG
jgi:hypothetical protein